MTSPWSGWARLTELPPSVRAGRDQAAAVELLQLIEPELRLQVAEPDRLAQREQFEDRSTRRASVRRGAARAGRPACGRLERPVEAPHAVSLGERPVVRAPSTSSWRISRLPWLVRHSPSDARPSSGPSSTTWSSVSTPTASSAPRSTRIGTVGAPPLSHGVRHLVVAVHGGDDEQRIVGQQVVDDGERRPVDAVRVVDEQHRSARFGARRLQHAAHGVEHPSPPDGAGFVPGAPVLQRVGGQEVGDGGQRRRAVGAVGRCTEHPPAGVGGERGTRRRAASCRHPTARRCTSRRSGRRRARARTRPAHRA